MRYDGYSDPLEVMVEMLRELKKITELLTPKEPVKTEQPKLTRKVVVKNDTDNKPKNTPTRKRSNRGGSNSTK